MKSLRVVPAVPVRVPVAARAPLVAATAVPVRPVPVVSARLVPVVALAAHPVVALPVVAPVVVPAVVVPADQVVAPVVNAVRNDARVVVVATAMNCSRSTHRATRRAKLRFPSARSLSSAHRHRRISVPS